MKKTPDPILGGTYDEEGDAIVTIDVDRLVETRLVLTAISGGGKSHAIRRILEQTHGKIQHIVLDPEGEFYTLREKFPYVLAGKGGDCPAEPRSAALLAQKLLELRVSAIVDLYELRPDERTLFVKLFIDSLLNAPKSLRHPCIVVVDEAHTFAPEKGEGEAVSRNSVIALMAQGRKRLLCPILATQRLSKLDKNAISEAHNMMIGKSILDIDVARAMRYLGFQKQSEEKVRRMPRGHFWTFGPAFTDEVVDVMVGPTITATPKLGSRVKAPAPPSKDIQKILGKLADLPEEALKREQTEKYLRAEIAELKKSLRAVPAIKFAQPPPVEKVVTKIVEKAVISAKQMKSIVKFVEHLDALTKIIELRGNSIVASGNLVRESMLKVRDAISPPAQPLPQRRVLSVQPISPSRADSARKTNLRVQVAAAGTEKRTIASDNGKLGPCERKILSVLAQYQDDGCDKGKLAFLSGYRYSGGFRNSLSKLRTSGLIVGDNEKTMTITETGMEAAGPVQPLPTGEELFSYWRSHSLFGPCEKAIMDVLRDPSLSLTGPEIAPYTIDSAGNPYEYSGGFRNSLSKLRVAGVITGTSNTAPIRLNDNLFQ